MARNAENRDSNDPNSQEDAKEEQSATDEFIQRCRYHGLKAVQLDPMYINGYRDLAVSLIRHGRYNEAYQYFRKALKLAVVVDKDLEIIADAVKVLKKCQVSSAELNRWRHPDPRLLEPPK